MKSLKTALLPLIDRVGSYFGVNARYFTQQGSFTLVAHGINIVYGILVSYLSALLFSQELFGQYRFVLSIIGMCAILKLSGLSTAISRSLSKNEKGPLVYTLKLYLLPAALFGITLLSAIAALQFWGRNELWPLFVVAALLAPIEAAALTFAGGIITGKALFKDAIYYSVTAKLLNLLLTVPMFIFTPSPVALLAIILGVNIVVYGTFVYRYLPRYTTDNSDTSVFTYGAKLSLFNIPGTIVWHIDSLLISAYFGLTQLAIFSVAILIPEQFKMLFKELLAVSFSRQAAGSDTMARRQHLIAICVKGTVLFLLFIIAYWVSADYFFGIIFPQYNDPRTIFISKLMFATLIVVPWNLVPQYLEAHGATVAVRNSNLYSSGVFLLCLLWLIPAYGLLGAVISRAMFRITYTLISIFYLYTAPIFTND